MMSKFKAIHFHEHHPVQNHHLVSSIEVPVAEQSGLC